jgi:hypothetical protein
VEHFFKHQAGLPRGGAAEEKTAAEEKAPVEAGTPVH